MHERAELRPPRLEPLAGRSTAAREQLLHERAELRPPQLEPLAGRCTAARDAHLMITGVNGLVS